MARYTKKFMQVLAYKNQQTIKKKSKKMKITNNKYHNLNLYIIYCQELIAQRMGKTITSNIDAYYVFT